MYIDHIPSADNGTLKFSRHKEHLTHDVLATEYEDRCRLFRSKTAAEEFAATQPHAWVSRVVNYKHSDIRTIYQKDENGKNRCVAAEIVPGAQPYEVGWLVSLVGRRVPELRLIKK